MATITAALTPQPASPAPGVISQRVTIFPQPLMAGSGPPKQFPLASAQVASQGLYGNLTIPYTYIGANLLPSYTEEYYDRIHVLPSSFDAGNVSSTISYEVEVWNAFFVPRTLTAIDQIDADGINVLNGKIPGSTFGVLESDIYDIEVTPDGPPAIEALLKWTFGVDFGTHVITGTRLVLFAFKPAAPITEKLAWKTNVMRAYSGEQRVALRKHPRQTWDMRYKQSEGELQSRMNSAMWGRNFKAFGLPVWTDVTYIYSSIAAGTTTIYLDTRYFDYRVEGLLVLLYRDDITNEAKEILEVYDDRIVLKRPLEMAFPDGAMAMPVVICQPEGGIVREDIGNDVNISQIRFRAIDNLEYNTTAPETYLGYEILLDYNIRRSQSVQSAIVHPSVTVDNQTGPWDTFAYREQPDEIFDWSWVADNPEARWNNKMFLMRQRGRIKPFWIKTRRPDFILAETMAGSSTSMPVKNMGQEKLDLIGDTRHIEVVMKDGTEYRRIIDALGSESTDKQTQYVEINSAFGVDILPEDVDRISYLRLVRIDTDEVEIEHSLGIYSQFTVPLITVEQPTP